ncbi:MAG: sugar phosphate isomerase/epimerase family protein [Gemmataceae bacterium]
MKIGLRLESLDLPLRRAVDEAARLGVAGIQVDAVGDLSPKQLSQTGRREFRTLLSARNLSLAALGCPLRRGLDAAENQQARLEHVQNVMALAFELGARVVIVPPGRLPLEGQPDPLREPLLALGQHGDRIGCTLACETGLEAGDVLAAYLARFDTGSLAANFDPGNLVVHGFNPYQSVAALGRFIAQVHARDARGASPSRAAREVPLGAGDINWLDFFDALREQEYQKWVVVVRDDSNNRHAEVAHGVEFLRRFIA